MSHHLSHSPDLSILEIVNVLGVERHDVCRMRWLEAVRSSDYDARVHEYAGAEPVDGAIRATPADQDTFRVIALSHGHAADDPRDRLANRTRRMAMDFPVTLGQHVSGPGCPNEQRKRIDLLREPLHRDSLANGPPPAVMMVLMSAHAADWPRQLSTSSGSHDTLLIAR